MIAPTLYESIIDTGVSDVSHFCMSFHWSEFAVMLFTLEADICFQLVHASGCMSAHLGNSFVNLTVCSSICPQDVRQSFAMFINYIMLFMLHLKNVFCS